MLHSLPLVSRHPSGVRVVLFLNSDVHLFGTRRAYATKQQQQQGREIIPFSLPPSFVFSIFPFSSSSTFDGRHKSVGASDLYDMLCSWWRKVNFGNVVFFHCSQTSTSTYLSSPVSTDAKVIHPGEEGQLLDVKIIRSWVVTVRDLRLQSSSAVSRSVS